jgi:hypothetical protein
MTMDREQKIAEIREALEMATPGPWNFAVFEDSRHVIFDNTFLSRHIAEIVRGGVESEQREEDNAHLIANAPEWLGFLLDELERVEKAADNFRKHDAATHEHLQLVQIRLDYAVRENERLREQRDKLIEGLRWYADAKNYRREFRSRHGTLVEPAEAIYYDCGQSAREILEEIGVTVE